MVTQKRANEIIEQYVPILHLQDWIIKAKVVDQAFLQYLQESSNTFLGVIVIREEDKMADIYIWKHCDTNINNVTVEAVVVHELVHLYCHDIKTQFNVATGNLPPSLLKFIDFYFDTALETLVNKITRVVLELTGKKVSYDIDYRMISIKRAIKNNDKNTPP